MRNLHKNAIVKLGVALALNNYSKLEEIGIYLQNSGVDKMANGGFWLYRYSDEECFYSDRFIETLGYRKDEIAANISFFYKVGNVDDLARGSQMANELIEKKSESCFINNLIYTMKDGTTILIECSGTILYNNGNPHIVLGTHVILA